jgi:hypothetical protein
LLESKDVGYYNGLRKQEMPTKHFSILCQKLKIKNKKIEIQNFHPTKIGR